jgi:hypothetical protein
MGFSGNIKGVQSEMYAINKQQQFREWQLLQAVCEVRGVAFELPNPVEAKISVKKWDALQIAQIAALGWQIEKVWRIRAGESEYRKRRFIALYKAIFKTSDLCLY